MRVVAYTALHYGKEYLRYAIASVANIVERHYILYSPRPSFGHGTRLQCPDTREELIACTKPFGHTIWIDGEWESEGRHRNALWEHLNGNELVVVVDADEVWAENALRAVVALIKRQGTERNVGIYGFTHLWRSFHWCCRDPLAPIRLINLSRSSNGTQWTGGEVYHFGYAQSMETMRYKWAIHGHQPELREGWLDKYEHWKPGEGDIHPTNDKWWDPEPFYPIDLPRVMRDHPYYGKDLIE
tara:strand:+ start:3151 stop:3876 length:726 start_codon:yes stop_codon:yes gene_type:complete